MPEQMPSEQSIPDQASSGRATPERVSSDQATPDRATPDRASPEQGFPDQVSLAGHEARVYEAIATLEYLGLPVGTAEITSATGLGEPAVGESIGALTARGVLVEHEQDGRQVYEPAYRGWSTAPEQSAGPQR